MPEITEQSSLEEVAAIVSDALDDAAEQHIDWEALKIWFANEGESDQEYQRFRDAVSERR